MLKPLWFSDSVSPHIITGARIKTDLSFCISERVTLPHDVVWNVVWSRYQVNAGRHLYALWSWWRHQLELFSALLVLCAGNSPVNVEFPSQRPVTRSFAFFFHMGLNRRLSKQLWGWWFKMPLCHYDVTVTNLDLVNRVRLEFGTNVSHYVDAFCKEERNVLIKQRLIQRKIAPKLTRWGLMPCLRGSPGAPFMNTG